MKNLLLLSSLLLVVPSVALAEAPAGSSVVGENASAVTPTVDGARYEVGVKGMV